MKKVLIPGLVAGVLMLIISLVLGQAFSYIFPSIMEEYQNISLFRPWDDPLMWYMYLHPFVMGLFLAWAWDKVKPVVKEKDPLMRGVKFGSAFWVVCSVPGMLMSWSSFQLSFVIVLSWSISLLVEEIVAGAVFAKMNK